MSPERPESAQERSSVRHLKVPGGSLAYETAGQGLPLLFIHSVIADRRMWDREFPVYSADHQTVRFDLRGFGGSSSATAPFSYGADLEALATHLHLDRPYLVGSSMGGALAIDYALAHPDRVRGLMLVAPGLSGGFEPPFDAEEAAAFAYDEAKSQEINRAWSDHDTTAAVDLLGQLWCSALEGPNRELFHTMVRQNLPEVFDNRSMKLATDPPPAAGRLSDIRVPTTILLGDRDNPSSAVFAKRIARSIRGSRLVAVPGGDHLVNLSAPGAFDRELRSALSELR